MTVQDDRRENELITLFQLEKPAKATRSGTDAILNFANQQLAFELKSTTKSSVTTVRDFSPDHIKKWQSKHWLFGFYEPGGKTLKYCLYGSPKAMAPWIEEKAAYIKLDYQLAGLVPELITKEVLYKIIGQKEVYSLEHARQLQKKQDSIQKYRDKMDMEKG